MECHALQDSDISVYTFMQADQKCSMDSQELLHKDFLYIEMMVLYLMTYISVPWDTVFDIIVLVHDDAGRVNIGLGTKEFLRNLLLK